MRLSVFLLLAAGMSVAMGVLAALTGASLWSSIGCAAVTLVLLQVGYFLFIAVSARKVDQSKLGDNGE